VRNISNDFTKYMTQFLGFGPDGVEALINIVLRKSDGDEQRLTAIQQLIPQLAQRLPTTDNEQMQVELLNALIRVATSDHSLRSLDSASFNILFAFLSSQRPQAVRSRAIVLLSTIMSKEESNSNLLSSVKSQLSNFITDQLSTASPTEYITALSVLTSIFTIRSEMGAEIFLQEGFLEEIVEDGLDLEDENVPKALLELLSAASVDKSCRAKILNVADGFLQECAHSTDTEKRALSGSILAKLSSASGELSQTGMDLLKIFNNAYQSKNETALQSAVEGLAFSSTIGKTKEELTKDPNFLHSIMGILKSPGRQHPLIYGCLSVLVNLTFYKPPLTEEEKRINEIRRMAKETNIHTIDKLDDNAHVSTRCKAVLSAGLLPSLNVMATNSSPACITAIAYILLSVSTTPAHRGLMAQQGAIKLILALLTKPVDQNTEITLAHALAKILISVNPSLIFSSRTPITAPIQPLTSLLTNESLPNELPRFETLLALTNLASAEDSARSAIVDKAWTVTETLLLSDTPLLQRAATELVCNLVVSQKGTEKFLPSKGTSASSRLHLLLALADVDDVATRRAAGGALAMLTDLKEICVAIGEVERGVERVGGMVGDDDEDVAFRGMICMRNLMENAGTDLKKRIVVAGMFEKIQKLMKGSTNDRVKNLGQEISRQIG
jgi:protein unc-45